MSGPEGLTKPGAKYLGSHFDELERMYRDAVNERTRLANAIMGAALDAKCPRPDDLHFALGWLAQKAKVAVGLEFRK
jgi:hypothetical protein